MFYESRGGHFIFNLTYIYALEQELYWRVRAGLGI